MAVGAVVEHLCGFEHDLLFEEGFDDDGAGTGLCEAGVAFRAFSKARTANDNRVLKFQARKCGC